MTVRDNILKLASFFDDRAGAEKIIFDALDGNQIADTDGTWTLQHFVAVQEDMFQKRVRSGTPHKLSILQGSLDSIRSKKPLVRNGGVTMKPGWASWGR